MTDGDLRTTVSEAIEQTYPFMGKSWGQRIAVTLAAVVPLALTAFAIVGLWGDHVTWLDLALLGAGYGITVLGITLGYHRMLTHGAFKAKAPVRFALLAAGVTSLEGSPASWAAPPPPRAQRQGRRPPQPPARLLPRPLRLAAEGQPRPRRARL